MSRKEVDQNEKRGMIIGYVGQNPGATYTEIRDALGMGNGQLTGHLNKLDKELMLIRSLTTGVNKRFFPRKFDLKNVPPEFGHPIQQKIVKILANSPDRNQKELSEILAIPKSTVRYHLNSLVGQGRVKIKNHGRKMQYSIVENGHYVEVNSYQKTLIKRVRK